LKIPFENLGQTTKNAKIDVFSCRNLTHYTKAGAKLTSFPHQLENDGFLMQKAQKSKKKINYEHRPTTPTACVEFYKLIQEFDNFPLTMHTQHDSIILNFHEYTVTLLLRDDGRCEIPLDGKFLHRFAGEM
jgi:hypothetical protein